MRSVRAVSILLFFVILLSPLTGNITSVAAQSPTDLQQSSGTAIQLAFDYLKTQQNPDGGISWVNPGISDVSTTARVVLALAGAGLNQSTLLSTENHTPMEYLSNQANAYSTDGSGKLFPGNAGLLLLAAAATDQDLSTFAEMDLRTAILSTMQADGSFSTDASEGWTTGTATGLTQSLAILGLVSAGVDVPDLAITWLKNNQTTSGAFDNGWGPDPDTSGMAVTALLGTGKIPVSDPVIQKALNYFRTIQLSGGGWRPDWDTAEMNPSTTGWIIQALVSAGYTPTDYTWAAANGNPVSSILLAQQANGVIGYGYSANSFGTAEGLLGLIDQPIYFLGVSIRANRSLSYLQSLQQADGGFGSTSATLDTVLAFASAGYDPASLDINGITPIDYLMANAGDYADDSVDKTGKLGLVLAEIGQNCVDFSGLNVVDRINAHYNYETHSFGTATNSWYQAYSIFGLSACGASLPETNVIDTLLALQQEDGGWTYDTAWGIYTDVDSTALVLQALVTSGMDASDPAVVNALTYLHNQQDAQGGWGNTNATAFAIQALLSLGENLEEDWSVANTSPVLALRRYQKTDGPFTYIPWGTTIPVDDSYATRQSIPALMSRSFPNIRPEAPLQSFAASLRGRDPDSLVMGTLRVSPRDGIRIYLPFSGDPDGDATVTVEYRPSSAGEWTAIPVARSNGYFETHLNPLGNYNMVIRVTVSDPDLIQKPDGTLLLSQSSIHTQYLVQLPVIKK